MAERRKLIRESSARLGPSEEAEVVHQVSASTVVGVISENLWSDATFFKAQLGDRHVYFCAEDAVQTEEDVTLPGLLSLLDVATPDAAADGPSAPNDVEWSPTDEASRAVAAPEAPAAETLEDTASSESVHPARRSSKKRLAFTSDQTTPRVSRKVPQEVGPAVMMIVSGLLIIAVSAGVLALTTAYPIGGYSIVAKGGFVFGPLMAIMGLFNLVKGLLASFIEWARSAVVNGEVGR